MKKVSPIAEDEFREEYKRSDFSKVVRGKYSTKIAVASNVVLLVPSVSKVFPSGQAVNDALRFLIDIVREAPGPTQPPRGR